MSPDKSDTAKLGLLLLFANPLVLLIIIGVVVAVIFIGIGSLVYYGLITALAFLIVSAGALVALHYFKALDLTKYPYLAVIPFGLMAVGYVGERLNVISVASTVDTSMPSPERIFILQLFLVVLIIAGVAGIIIKLRK